MGARILGKMYGLRMKKSQLVHFSKFFRLPKMQFCLPSSTPPPQSHL